MLARANPRQLERGHSRPASLEVDLRLHSVATVAQPAARHVHGPASALSRAADGADGLAVDVPDHPPDASAPHEDADRPQEAILVGRSLNGRRSTIALGR